MTLAGARTPDIRSRPAARLGAITQVLALAVAARVTLYAPSARQSWARGWLFSFATYALGLYWIFISLHRYGDLAAPLAAPLLLSAFLAIFPATACALRAACAADSPPARALGALTWAALWPASNGARGAAHRLSLAEHRLCPCR